MSDSERFIKKQMREPIARGQLGFAVSWIIISCIPVIGQLAWLMCGISATAALRELEKYNQGVAEGFRLMEFSPKMIKQSSAIFVYMFFGLLLAGLIMINPESWVSKGEGNFGILMIFIAPCLTWASVCSASVIASLMKTDPGADMGRACSKRFSWMGELMFVSLAQIWVTPINIMAAGICVMVLFASPWMFPEGSGLIWGMPIHRALSWMIIAPLGLGAMLRTLAYQWVVIDRILDEDVQSDYNM